MKTLKFLFLNIVVVLFFIGCSEDPTNDAPNNTLDTSKNYEALDVPYGTHQRQTLDIYLPANRNASTKTMILIHGGGWSSGSKSDMNAIGQLMRKDVPNLAIVNINYRLADENNSPYPMQIDDITSVVNFLKENKIKYSISEDIGFTGLSAGAHLSLLWSYAFDTNNKVDMVCSIVGPTNLNDPAYLNNTSPALQELLDLYGANASTEFLKEVSPLHQLKASSPPTILFYGGKDPLIPTSQGTDLRDELVALNVTHQFTLYPNAGHGWLGLELLDTWAKLKLFTETHL
ncbi:alpha/beta hydrolase [Algibacter sp. 2305UL17-15]|uniref:alpha/beta hydrolase n=1 Tax=Algibacter sp. 2305UL17-15 TaxID=3231268 RepID=UPI003458CFBC